MDVLREPDNEYDSFAVAIMLEETVVGRVPRELLKHFSRFLLDGVQIPYSRLFSTGFYFRSPTAVRKLNPRKLYRTKNNAAVRPGLLTGDARCRLNTTQSQASAYSSGNHFAEPAR